MTIADEAPPSWSGLNCVLIPDEVYKKEESNIRVQWCMDQESECSKLLEGAKINFPHFFHQNLFFIMLGYGYESGDDCGAGTNVELVEASPDLVDTSFNCKIMVPGVFSDLTKDLMILHCLKDPSCTGLPTMKVTNMSSWTGYATSTVRSVI